EDEVGALLKLGGVLWAHRALGVREATPPAFGHDETLALVRAIQAAARSGRMDVSTDGNGADPNTVGIGHSLDSFVEDAPKDVRATLQGFRDYLVAAANEIGGREDAKVADLFPAIDALGRKRSKLDGLDDAAREFMTRA